MYVNTVQQPDSIIEVLLPAQGRKTDCFLFAQHLKMGGKQVTYLVKDQQETWRETFPRAKRFPFQPRGTENIAVFTQVAKTPLVSL